MIDYYFQYMVLVIDFQNCFQMLWVVSALYCFLWKTHTCTYLPDVSLHTRGRGYELVKCVGTF